MVRLWMTDHRLDLMKEMNDEMHIDVAPLVSQQDVP